MILYTNIQRKYNDNPENITEEQNIKKTTNNNIIIIAGVGGIGAMGLLYLIYNHRNKNQINSSSTKNNNNSNEKDNSDISIKKDNKLDNNGNEVKSPDNNSNQNPQESKDNNSNKQEDKNNIQDNIIEEAYNFMVKYMIFDFSRVDIKDMSYPSSENFGIIMAIKTTIDDKLKNLKVKYQNDSKKLSMINTYIDILQGALDGNSTALDNYKKAKNKSISKLIKEATESMIEELLLSNKYNNIFISGSNDEYQIEEKRANIIKHNTEKFRSIRESLANDYTRLLEDVSVGKTEFLTHIQKNIKEMKAKKAKEISKMTIEEKFLELSDKLPIIKFLEDIINDLNELNNSNDQLVKDGYNKRIGDHTIENFKGIINNIKNNKIEKNTYETIKSLIHHFPNMATKANAPIDPIKNFIHKYSLSDFEKIIENQLKQELS